MVPRARRLVAVLAVGVIAALTGTVGGPAMAIHATPPAVVGAAPASAVSRRPIDVIVQARPGRIQAARAALIRAGGAVRRELPLVDAFAARVTGRAVPPLRADPAVRAVWKDRAATFASAGYGPGRAGSTYPITSGATRVWRETGFGRGSAVALIDTGVADVDDLRDRVVAGPDFSGERDSRLDSYGHGTVMAGIIAGDGADSRHDDSPGMRGMAPRATVVAVKVAGRNGATDVSNVLAAMQWVASFRDRYRIRVVNLSWGTPSTQSPAVDPLNYAVERLWRLGIVVVTAAGNAGPVGASVVKPGDDPAVITVGAYDEGLAAGVTPAVTDWSSRGPSAAGVAKPDLVAPGQSIVATNAPGSFIDTTYRRARVSEDYIRGSGTSQATAVTSGAVALILAKRPSLTPDDVKYALTSTADSLAGAGAAAQGEGRLAVAAALDADTSVAPRQPLTGTGLGSLEGSRGGRHVVTTCAGSSTPAVVVGEIDALCQPWEPQRWTGDAWSADSWSASTWSGDSWSADSWSGDSWSADSWSGDSWSAPPPLPGRFSEAFWGSSPPPMSVREQ